MQTTKNSPLASDTQQPVLWDIDPQLRALFNEDPQSAVDPGPITPNVKLCEGTPDCDSDDGNEGDSLPPDRQPHHEGGSEA